MTKRFSVLVIAALAVPAKGAEPPKQPTLEILGYVVPVRTAAVTSSVAGRVTKVLVREGESVKKGDVLAELDDRLARLDVLRAEAVLRQAEVKLKHLPAGPGNEETARAKELVREAEATLRTREETLAQLRRLLGEGAASEKLRESENAVGEGRKQLDQLRLELAKAQGPPRPELVEASKSEVILAQADLERARLILDAHVLRAPIDGVVLHCGIEEGGAVAAPGSALPGTLFALANLNELDVEIALPERDLGRVTAGQRCEVRAVAFPDVVYQAKVALVLPTVDRARSTVTVRVRIDVPRDDQRLKPEMGAKVSVFALGK